MCERYVEIIPTAPLHVLDIHGSRCTMVRNRCLLMRNEQCGIVCFAGALELTNNTQTTVYEYVWI